MYSGAWCYQMSLLWGGESQLRSNPAEARIEGPGTLYVHKGQGKSCHLLKAKCLPPFSRPAFLLGCEFAAGWQLLKGKDGSSSPTCVAV